MKKPGGCFRTKMKSSEGKGHVSDSIRDTSRLPPQQEAIRAKCFHPSGKFVEFPIEDVETSIPERFEKIVQLYPNRIAVRTPNDTVTYAELNAMANRMAHSLLERLGRKTQLVTILLGKDVSQLANMLAVIKAGKFFLILDPTFPKARIAAMLADSRAKFVVTNRRYASLAHEVATSDRQLLEWETLNEDPHSDDLGLRISPQALAFINYTSGSTGEPKGLLRTHRMILHNIMLRTNLVHVCEHDRISLLSSGTSNAITNTYLALLNGAGLFSLELKQEGVMRLASWLSEERITIAPMSSPLFRSLCETLPRKENFPDLRVVRLRSEAVYREDADLYKTYFSRCCVFVTGLSSNETGPLRDFLIDHQSEVSGRAVPVGYAVAGKAIRLLDELGNEVRLGEVGEIAVRSRYLSPGYLRRPQLTKAKFRPDPKGEGKRLYLTGDLGMMLPDGCLVYKGRKDFRIKIRGYGVDLKEVELALRRHPAVADVVVVARENERKEKELIGYFTSTSRTRPSESDLRSVLGQTLADYMIPSAFVMLDSIPLTPHNKVDRNALPQPGHCRPQLGTPFTAPRIELERELAKIWSEVLSVEQVGIHDDFFDLGGHSLAATRIISRVIETYALQVPLQSLFDSPTIAKMATVIMGLPQMGDRSVPSDKAPINKHKVRPTNKFIEFERAAIEESIPHRFEKVVGQFPDRIAVKMRKEIVSYSALNAAANRVARVILAQQGDRSKPVGLLLGKGIAQIVAMLGVLKAGKFFVLLDPSLPRSRITEVLDDTQAGLLITDRNYLSLGRTVRGEDCQLMDVQSLDRGISTDNLCLKISPNALASIVYTSGSSGSAKGVLQSHQNLLHRIKVYTQEYHICAQDRVSLLSFATSSSITNTLCALLNGAMLLSFDVRREGVAGLASWLSQEKISVCWISSPLFRNLCEILQGEEWFSNLRLIGVRSESVYKTDFELYKKYFPRACLFSSSLSSTESGTLSIYFADHDTEIAGNMFPVGYPVTDKEIFLLDDEGNKVGFNQVGEIVVRSRYLSPGYWRRPGLTDAKFKQDQESVENRLYFTGDLGVMLPDGCLIFKGRKDSRVKVRGYGVEIAEVERALRGHRAVGDAVVVQQQNESDETRLVAYFTCSNPAVPSVSELRRFMNKQVPDYMVPSVFYFLEMIPLTANGKVDRKALPSPDKSRPVLDATYVAASSPEEKTLAKIWTDVLGVDAIGVYDTFFDFGGHSLQAARVVSRIHDAFQVEVPLEQFFDTPTIAALADYIEKSRPLRGGKEEFPAPAASGSGQIPLSFSQQRLWFLDQLDPGSFTYNLFSAYRLKGELNVAALEQSSREIVRRHEVLRTVFKSEGGNPVQVVLPTLAITIPVFDLRGTVSEEDRWAEVRRVVKEEAQRPFDLATGPLLRITLLQLADDEYVLLRAMHHIVSDGWSGGVLFRELAALYEAFSNGQPSPLADLTTQYTDYAVWQRQWFQGEILESQLAYWKKQLENIPTLQLPTDRPRPVLQSSRGGRQYFSLSNTLSSELKELSSQHGATLFMTLLAAFQTLLSRYSGQTDIAIGSPVAGRSRREFESLIGFFLNTLVLRTDLSGNPTFVEAMTRVREMCLGALSHQELPFEKLVEELQPERDLGHNPLFQVTFAFQNTPRFAPQLSGVRVNQLEVDTGIARFDLHLFMEEIDGQLRGYCDYDTDLFDAATIERMVGHFQTLLEGIIANPDLRISELPLLGQVERNRLLTEWNDTRREYPKDKCIHELFEEQVERSPDAVAVVFEEQQLTYKELNGRASQVAHYLRKLGVGPESLVAICMDRSLDMIVALLGILKAGGAYVPLDPSYPQERLAFMLEDTKAGVLVTQRHLADGLHRRSKIEDGDSQDSVLPSQAKVICVDADWNEITKESSDNPISATIPENLAYVIYTSGSTGRPKGVAMRHRPLCNLVSWQLENFTFSEARTLQFASLSFDVSFQEIFSTWCSGGILILIPEELPRDPVELLQCLEKQAVERLFLPVVALQQLADTADQEGITQLRIREIITAGEQLCITSSIVNLLTRLPDCKLRNHYGPSESHVVSAFTLPDTRSDWTLFPPIGKPIANTQIYILDAHLQPVPVGVTGELHISGDGLARGYLNRPELTAEKFIPNPFSGDPKSRLYRTGDLARYLPDGNIEFLGRIDEQVKIRGYRIELGEIETALSQHPVVRRSVVMVREDSPGNKRLVAYVVLSQDQVSTASELRSFLREKLPEYMVPSGFVFLESLPLTPNGKVDRRALPVIDQSRPELEQSFEAPRTLIEEIVAQIWAEVLKVEKVGVHDNFFDLGGHSLLAAQLVSRIRDAFRIELPLRNLFEAPTVGGVANHIELFRQQTAGLRTLPIVPEVIDGECPLSFAQERFWVLEQLEPNNLAYHVTYSFRLHGPLNIDALEKTISEIVRRHETLRTTFHVRNGKPVQVISEDWSSPLDVLDLRQHPPADRDAEVQRIFESEYRCTFDLSRDLLLRATLLQLGTDEHVLLLNSHHIAWDHWCMDILFREVALLYRAYVAGEPSPFPDPTIQYRHYALWQRNVFDRAELQDHLTYWKEQLRGVPQSLNLPTDHARKPLGNRRGGRERLILPKSLTDGLRTLSREASVTLFMTFLAAFQTLLHRITHQDDIVVGTPVAGRDRSETEGLIGLFLNSLALRTDLSDNPTFFELLRRVREVALGAYDHQDLPFEKLVEELQPKRDLTRTPIFQVFINMFNFKESTLELDGLSAKRLQFNKSHAQFDITLFILQQNEGVELSFQYDAELFEHSTIVRMLGNFKTLLKGIVVHPDHRICDIPLL